MNNSRNIFSRIGFLWGFTMMEMMVVLVIISLIAAFGIPNYRRAVDRADERNQIMNLLTMRSAVEVWAARNNNTYPIGVQWSDLAEINAALGLNLSDSASAYACNWIAAETENGCAAARLPADWIIHFHGQGPLHCDSGACPTCGADCG